MRFKYFKYFLLLGLLTSVLSCKSDDNDGDANDPLAENRKGLGESAEDILSSDTYKSLTIEMVFEPSIRPTEIAVQRFKDFINERVDKPGGVTFIETVVEPQPGAPYSIQEIREIETDIRTAYTEGDNLAVFVYFPSGRSSNDTQTTVTLGTAYQNTSVVVYESTLRLLTESNQDLLPILESTTLHHEFGHILGLTNVSDDDIHQEHEDTENAKHCMVEDCLMYFDATSVTETQFRQLMTRMERQAEVPVLDPLCLEDLAAKGGN